MIQSIQKSSYHIIVYSIGNILLKLVGIILAPIYTSVFSPFEFGIIGIIETTSMLITTVLSLNLSSALLRWLSDIDPDPNKQHKEKSIVFTILLLTIFLISVFSIFTFPLLKQISQVLFSSNIQKSLLLLVFINIYIDIINRITLNLIRAKEKTTLYLIAMILKSIVTLAANIVLLKLTTLGIYSVIIAGILGNLVFLISTTPLLIKNIYFNFLKSEVSGIIKFSFPLIFVTLGTILLNMGDRYVLDFYRGLDEVGIYTFAFKIASIANMVVLQGINLAILPIALKSFASEEGKIYLSKIMTFLTLVLCLMFLTISFLPSKIFEFFARNNDYMQAQVIIPFLLFAYIFDGLRTIFSYHMLFVKKTIWIAVITLSSAALNIILNILFIPKYGIMGAASTTLFTSFITCFVYNIVAQKMIHVKYQYFKIFLMIGISLIIFLTIGR